MKINACPGRFSRSLYVSKQITAFPSGGTAVLDTQGVLF